MSRSDYECPAHVTYCSEFYKLSIYSRFLGGTKPLLLSPRGGRVNHLSHQLARSQFIIIFSTATLYYYFISFSITSHSDEWRESRTWHLLLHSTHLIVSYECDWNGETMDRGCINIRIARIFTYDSLNLTVQLQPNPVRSPTLGEAGKALPFISRNSSVRLIIVLGSWTRGLDQDPIYYTLYVASRSPIWIVFFHVLFRTGRTPWEILDKTK
jgi:hypothetical protein